MRLDLKSKNFSGGSKFHLRVAERLSALPGMKFDVIVAWKPSGPFLKSFFIFYLFQHFFFKFQETITSAPLLLPLGSVKVATKSRPVA